MSCGLSLTLKGHAEFLQEVDVVGLIICPTRVLEGGGEEQAEEGERRKKLRREMI